MITEELEAAMTTVAVDLGGTHCRAAVVPGGGAILGHQRVAIPRNDPTPSFLAELVKHAIEDASRAGNVEEPDRVVLGLPGIVDHRFERLISAPNLPPSWLELLNGRWLSGLFDMPVSLANDADLAAVGEATYGAGRSHRDVAYMTISTGVGAGAVVGGKLVRGSNSGFEIGHLVIDYGAAERGQPATVEALGSGSAIEREAAAAGFSERGADFAALVQTNAEAKAIWDSAIRAAGLGLVALAWTVVPTLIVVGGGVGCNEALVRPVLQEQLRLHGPKDLDFVEIVSAALGDDAALAGGAAWWDAIGHA